MKTIEQQRAANAFDRVAKLERETSTFKERYRAYVNRIGPSIVMNGLGQALATERAAAGPNPQKDDERAHHELYVSLSGWLCRPDGVYPAASDLLQALMGNDEQHYLRAQAESLAWLQWHKKCCRASFPKAEGEPG